MNFKFNINKIHSDLIVNFDNVTINEKSSLTYGEYFEITAISENRELTMIISKKDLNYGSVSWKYYSNPLKKNHLVEKNSSVDNLINDVKDIFEKNRFDSDYLETV